MFSREKIQVLEIGAILVVVKMPKKQVTVSFSLHQLIISSLHYCCFAFFLKFFEISFVFFNAIINFVFFSSFSFCIAPSCMYLFLVVNQVKLNLNTQNSFIFYPYFLRSINSPTFLIHWFSHFFHSLICFLLHLLVYSFIHQLIHSFNQAITHPFIHLFACSAIHLVNLSFLRLTFNKFWGSIDDLECKHYNHETLVI